MYNNPLATFRVKSYHNNMCDKRTLKLYNSEAEKYISDWDSQPTPTDIQNLILKFFLKNHPTCDIGFGSARELAWMHAQGFSVCGYEASEKFIHLASKKYPQIKFYKSLLPEISEIQDQSFAQVFCQTVIQHFEKSDALRSASNLVRILKPGGVLILSWRHPSSDSIQQERDSAGRLYTRLSLKEIQESISKNYSSKILEIHENKSLSSGKTITNLVLQKTE
jgi:2-polyprenyl-3-methyl-5-hydroxy-6-metoxy-1,4-benzoquinol methylase